ncbi:MAG TPA: nitrile hydratase subunit beta [Acidimicrobiia bacterium]|nr:nitrile hydratase subunit beta [Acidimicrobiia bacterium]
MDGIADMGGMQGWGSVAFDPEEANFTEDWHRKVFGMGLLSMRISGTNLDAFRHGIDRTHPVQYIVDGYWGRWLDGALNLLLDSGIVAPGEVEARVRKLAGEKDVEEPSPPTPKRPDYTPTAAGSIRQIDAKPRFSPGERVRAKDIHPLGHTRLVGYVRGHTGIVDRIQPAQVLPDTHAHFKGENAQHVYCVAFDSSDLWGDAGEKFTMYVDLYEDYLEAAS